MEPEKDFGLVGKLGNLLEGLIINKVVGEAAKLSIGHTQIPDPSGSGGTVSLDEAQAKAAEIQKNLQTAGLAKLDGDPTGTLHEEERSFEGNGVKVKTKVMVDEQGRVAKLLGVTNES